MPLHSWLPSAMVAPTPVSALLHAVAVVKVGVFSTVRVMLYVFGVDTMNNLNLGLPTAYFVSFTILMASVIALSKDNLKARLAYSTISQLSYVILGVALLKPEGIEGGLIHIANHAFSKITLFFCAGAIYVATHKKDISQMSGLGRAMPFTFGAFAVAALSMIGAPPVAGFISKWYLLLGALDAHSIAIIVVLLISTLLNVAYFAPVVYSAFFGKPSDGGHKTQVAGSASRDGGAAEHHGRHIGADRFLPRVFHEICPSCCSAMKLVQLIEYIRSHLKTVVRICLFVLAALILIDAIPALVDKEHAHTKAEHIPAFWAVFGFVGCVILILVSKWFGHMGIMKREDYYDE